MTNNYSESNSARLKRKLGLHPSLFKFLRAMKQEAAASEVKWLRQNCPAPKKRPEDQKKSESRQKWNAAFAECYAKGISDEELLPALDELLEIKKPTHKNQCLVQTFPKRRKGIGRGPVRGQTRK